MSEKKSTKSGAAKKKAAPKKSTRTTQSPLEGMNIPTKRQSLREEPIPIEHRWPYNSSIAQRKAVAEERRRKGILSWIAMGVLAVMAGILKFCMVGYSFSALVCLCLCGVLLFYRVTAMLSHLGGIRILRGIFTSVLIVGILVVSFTEALIIHAPVSMGTPLPCPCGTGSTPPMTI